MIESETVHDGRRGEELPIRRRDDERVFVALIDDVAGIVFDVDRPDRVPERGIAIDVIPSVARDLAVGRHAGCGAPRTPGSLANARDDSAATQQQHRDDTTQN